MNLKLKILLLATAPLMAAIAAISFLLHQQANELSRQEVAAWNETMLKTKKAELLNYTSLALTAIDHLYDREAPRSAEDEADAQEAVKRILTSLTYGPDGYFFVYDFKGNNIVHPKQPWRVGKNWWHLEDSRGNPVIQKLIEKAREGGGYHQYFWDKPSAGKIKDKIGYAVALERWGWMLGTGLYIDDVSAQVNAFKSDIQERVDETFYLMLGIATALVLFITGVGIAINIRESSLADSKLKALTQRIVQAQEEERGRVARELHDSISQILVSAKYGLELAEARLATSARDVGDAIDKTASRLQLAINEVRRISRDLRPGMLDDLGLSAALQSLTKDFADRTKIETDVRTIAFRDRLPANAKTALYRIAQEALTNVERHARASKVQLILDKTESGVMLKVTDNGRGFDLEALERPRRSPGGLGLKNIQERIEYLNGSLTVSSSSSGTTIEVLLPKTVLLSEKASSRSEIEVKSRAAVAEAAS